MRISLIYDIIRWEERSIIKALNDKNVDVSLIDVKNMNLDLKDNNYDFGDISLQRSTGYYRNLHSTAYVEFTGNKIVNNFNLTVITGNKMFTSLMLSKNSIKYPKHLFRLIRKHF